jgi:hypothetical protein
MKKDTKTNRESYQRVIAFLNRNQVDILDSIGKDALFSQGCKLSRIKIISCLVDLILELDINGKGISSLEELKQRIKEKIGSTWPSTRELLSFKENEDQPPNKGT